MLRSNVEAHNAYLQGHFHFQRRNLEDYRKAVGYFDQAIRLDPDYALAYTERSEAWSFIGDLTGQHEPAWSNARSDAEKAVAIAPDLAEAHAALGLGSVFCRLEVRRRDNRNKARERTLARKSHRKRSAGASDPLSGATR